MGAPDVIDSPAAKLLIHICGISFGIAFLSFLIWMTILYFWFSRISLSGFAGSVFGLGLGISFLLIDHNATWIAGLYFIALTTALSVDGLLSSDPKPEKLDQHC